MKRILSGLVVGMFFLITAGMAGATTYAGVEFPEGISSFADAVVSYDNLGAGVSVNHNNPDDALGAPNYDSNTDSNYVSLGWGGTITLQFTDNYLTTSGDSALDLWIFEIGAAVEPTSVEISADGTNWLSVGDVSGATSGIDIDSFISSGGVTLGTNYSYVRLTDLSTEANQTSGYPYAGADIDAVGAISSSSVPIPGAAWLLGSGILGLISIRRRNA